MKNFILSCLICLWINALNAAPQNMLKEGATLTVEYYQSVVLPKEKFFKTSGIYEDGFFEGTIFYAVKFKEKTEIFCLRKAFGYSPFHDNDGNLNWIFPGAQFKVEKEDYQASPHNILLSHVIESNYYLSIKGQRVAEVYEPKLTSLVRSSVGEENILETYPEDLYWPLWAPSVANTSDYDPFALDKISRLEPQTELEKQIITSQEWTEGASWGKYRIGKPEASVIYRIIKVLSNVENLYGKSSLKGKLRLIALLHDTFKNRVNYDLPEENENHRSTFARLFAEKFIDDPAILDVISLHEELDLAWKLKEKCCGGNAGKKRMLQLVDRLGSNLDLYIAFYECGYGNIEALDWFKGWAKFHNSLKKINLKR